MHYLHSGEPYLIGVVDKADTLRVTNRAFQDIRPGKERNKQRTSCGRREDQTSKANRGVRLCYIDDFLWGCVATCDMGFEPLGRVAPRQRHGRVTLTA